MLADMILLAELALVDVSRSRILSVRRSFAGGVPAGIGAFAFAHDLAIMLVFIVAAGLAAAKPFQLRHL